MNNAPKRQRDDTLDLLPKKEALKRADDLLRAMLNTPPDPHVAPKPKKAAKK
jgi:hypothetical protein